MLQGGNRREQLGRRRRVEANVGSAVDVPGSTGGSVTALEQGLALLAGTFGVDPHHAGEDVSVSTLSQVGIEGSNVDHAQTLCQISGVCLPIISG